MDQDAIGDFQVFAGASSGLLGDEDARRPPRRWSRASRRSSSSTRTPGPAPFAAAVRRNGGQLIATQRIPVQELIGALDRLED